MNTTNRILRGILLTIALPLLAGSLHAQNDTAARAPENPEIAAIRTTLESADSVADSRMPEFGLASIRFGMPIDSLEKILAAVGVARLDTFQQNGVVVMSVAHLRKALPAGCDANNRCGFAIFHVYYAQDESDPGVVSYLKLEGEDLNMTPDGERRALANATALFGELARRFGRPHSPLYLNPLLVTELPDTIQQQRQASRAVDEKHAVADWMRTNPATKDAYGLTVTLWRKKFADGVLRGRLYVEFVKYVAMASVLPENGE